MSFTMEHSVLQPIAEEWEVQSWEEDEIQQKELQSTSEKNKKHAWEKSVKFNKNEEDEIRIMSNSEEFKKLRNKVITESGATKTNESSESKNTSMMEISGIKQNKDEFEQRSGEDKRMLTTQEIENFSKILAKLDLNLKPKLPPPPIPPRRGLIQNRDKLSYNGKIRYFEGRKKNLTETRRCYLCGQRGHFAKRHKVLGTKILDNVIVREYALFK